MDTIVLYCLIRTEHLETAMTKSITSFEITRLLAILAACLLLSACEDHNWRDGFRGRSLHFAYRDILRDDRITRPEWERRYGTVVNDPMLVWFDELDCEGNGVVTWTEYYHNLFLRRDSCPERLGLFPSGYRGNDPRSGDILGEVTFCETDADFQRAIRSHREEQLTQVQLGKIEIECGVPVLGKPPYIGNVSGRCALRANSAYSMERALYSQISIRNQNPDATISVITLSVALSSIGSADLAYLKHLKTVSVPANSEQVVTAWFSIYGAEPVDIAQAKMARCELHSALGY